MRRKPIEANALEGGPGDEDLVVLFEHPGKLPAAQVARQLRPLTAFLGERPGAVRLRLYWHLHSRRVREGAVAGHVSTQDLEGLESFPHVRSAVLRPRSAAPDHREAPLTFWPASLGIRAGNELDSDDEALISRSAAFDEAIAKIDTALDIATLPKLRSQLERDRLGLLELATSPSRVPGQPPTPCEEWARILDEALDELCERARLVTLTELARHLGRRDTRHISESLRRCGFAWMGALPSIQ